MQLPMTVSQQSGCVHAVCVCAYLSVTAHCATLNMQRCVLTTQQCKGQEVHSALAPKSIASVTWHQMTQLQVDSIISSSSAPPGTEKSELAFMFALMP